MLKDRVITGIIIGITLLATILWLPSAGIPFVLLLISSLALWEFYKLLDVSGIPHFKFIGLLGGAGLITGTWWSLRHSSGVPYDCDWLVLFIVLISVFLRQFPQKSNPRPLITIAGTLLGFLYVPFLFNFFTKLLMGWGEGGGRWLIFYLIIVVKFTDMGAYFVGCAIGKHKLIPRISPAKTWEGCAGGVLAGLFGSILFFVITHGHIGSVSMTFGDAVILGILLSISGIVGDLTESLFKRAAGIKDSGRIIHGMGGILDVLDSLLFAAPALYTYARFFLN